MSDGQAKNAKYMKGEQQQLPHNRLVLGLVNHILGEPFEEAWILPLVDGTQHGGRGPATGVHN